MNEDFEDFTTPGLVIQLGRPQDLADVGALLRDSATARQRDSATARQRDSD